MKYFKLTLFSIFLFIGLVIGGYNSVKGLYLSNQAMTWITTQGVVSNLRFMTQKSDPKFANTSTRKIEYSYSVNDKNYLGDTEYFGLPISTNDQTTGGYLKGKTVTVYYNPKKHDQSVLKPFERKSIWLGFLITLVFSAFGGIGIFNLSRRNR